MHLETRQVLPASLIEEIYPSYVQAWDHMLPHVAARHVLTFNEFAEEMADPLIAKILVLAEHTGDVLGMTTLVTDIAAVPWTNAEFFRIRFADEINKGIFFYIGYSVVHRAIRGTRAIYLMVREVDRVVKQAQGVIGFDMSSFVTTRGFGRRLDHVFPSSEHVDHLDTQAYYVADYRPGSSTAAPATTSAEDFRMITLAEQPELLKPAIELVGMRFPAFMLAGHPQHSVNLQALIQQLPEHQVALIDSHGALRAAGFSLPLDWDGSTADLPAGRDEAIERSARLIADHGSATCVFSLSITVSSELRGRGDGARLIGGLIGAGREAGLSTLLAPVRPTHKTHYPLIPIEDYVAWTTPEGEAFDPWLRRHLEHGGEVLGVASRSITINGSVAEWEGWSGQRLPSSGSYVIKDGLAPVMIDREADLGRYEEPCIWVRHPSS